MGVQSENDKPSKDSRNVTTDDAKKLTTIQKAHGRPKSPPEKFRAVFLYQ